ncbi:hypothetical protein ACWFR1_14060 [Streptomyces sp. NPDC055103]
MSLVERYAVEALDLAVRLRSPKLWQAPFSGRTRSTGMQWSAKNVLACCQEPMAACLGSLGGTSLQARNE